MNHKLFETASKIATPLSLASLVMIALYLIYKAILELNIFNALNESSTFLIITSIIDKLFILALMGLMLGILSYIYVHKLKLTLNNVNIDNQNDKRKRNIHDVESPLKSQSLLFNPEQDEKIIKRMPMLENTDIYIERFAIKSHIGCGGFADVYLAWDEAYDNREVVLKIYKYNEQQNYIKKYIERDAFISRKFNSKYPGVIKTYEAKWLPGKIGLFIVQEYVNGRNLYEIINKQVAIDTKDCLEIAIKISETLIFLHKEKVAHCDIKPLNIILPSIGRPILIDFGSARFFDETLHKDEIAITFPYSSEEIMTGKSIDGRVDIYSLGMTLLHMIIGFPGWMNASRRSIDYATVPMAVIKESFDMPTKDEMRFHLKNSLTKISSEQIKTCISKALRIGDEEYSDVNEFNFDLIKCLDKMF